MRNFKERGFMQKILVINSKGGCGKTTVATNLASYFASHDLSAALLDFDPQGSSTRWLKLRPESKTAIYGSHVADKKNTTGKTRSYLMSVPADTERVIFDAPARVSVEELNELILQVDIIIIPVLPSSIDIHAVTRFVEELLVTCKVRQKGIGVGIVANRAKKTTLTYRSLERFLKSLRLPFITTLRETQNYAHAAERGIGISEMWDKRTDNDKEQWQPLVRWLDSAHEIQLMRDTARLF
jgi:chromosome partitioning protein